MRTHLTVALTAITAARAAAAPPHVDWARGLVTADGIGLADRHAPNPAVARGTSRRVAEDAARKVLAAAVQDLPLASGGTVASKAKDAAVKARLAQAVQHAIELAADPETDGAWRVTMAVPIEAVRQAIAGPRAVTQDAGQRVVIVDGASAKPAVGWSVGGIDGATLWVDALPAGADWAKTAPHVKAKSAKGGAIAVDGMDASPATLFVIIAKPPAT